MTPPPSAYRHKGDRRVAFFCILGDFFRSSVIGIIEGQLRDGSTPQRVSRTVLWGSF
jgi:hypothetical protein